MSSSKKRYDIAPDKEVDPKVFSEVDAERVARSIWGSVASSPFAGKVSELKDIMQSAANVYAEVMFELVKCENRREEWRRMRLFRDKLRGFRTAWDNLPESDIEEIAYHMYEGSDANPLAEDPIASITTALDLLEKTVDYTVTIRDAYADDCRREENLPKKVHVETHALRAVASDLKSKIEEFNSTPHQNKIKIARGFDCVEQKGKNDFSKLLLEIAKSIEPRLTASQCDSVMKS